jgi:hypothetical protein
LTVGLPKVDKSIFHFFCRGKNHSLRDADLRVQLIEPVGGPSFLCIVLIAGGNHDVWHFGEGFMGSLSKRSKLPSIDVVVVFQVFEATKQLQEVTNVILSP